MSTSVSILCRIQTVDNGISAAGAEIVRLNKEIESARKESGALGSGVEAIQREIEALDGVKREKEESVREKKERIEKDQKRLGELKNEKQIKAVTKEISDAEKSIRLLDMEISAILEKLIKKREELGRTENGVKEKDGRIKTLEEEFVLKKEELEKAIKEKLSEKENLSASVNPNDLKKYETIKARRAGVGIVSVKNETCQGCFIHIPPQVYIELKKGSHEIITCPHCHRILYFDKSAEPASA